MKIRPFQYRRLSVFPALLYCASGMAGITLLDADTSVVFAAPAATAIPPAAPVPGKYIAFSDKVAGRRLLFTSRDAYRNARALRVSAQWTLVNPDGRATTGTETILAQLGQGRLAITEETESNPKTINRAIAGGTDGGGTLLVTQYQAKTPNPTREYSRYPLDAVTSLPRSLQMARFNYSTKGAEFLLSPDLRFQNGALVYVSRPDSSNSTTTILQTDVVRNGDRNKLTRRYLVDTKTNRLRRYEEWRTTQGQPRPATKNRPADDGRRVTYRREDYTEAAAPITAAAFSQVLPPGYTEQTPTATLPPLTNQTTSDPKALALLRRWQEAQDRFLTLNAVADISTDVQQRTEISRPNRNGRGRYAALCTLWRMRPGQARIVVNDIDENTKQPKTKADYVAVADGQRVRINDYVNGRSDTENQRDPSAVPFNRMRQVVRQAWDSGIAWVFDGPPNPDDFKEMTLDSSNPDAPALVFSQTFKGNTGRGQKSETGIQWRVTLGPDNLPREIVSRRDTTVAGAYERDLPPIFTTRVRVQRVSVDSEPLPETFILPQEIVRR